MVSWPSGTGTRSAALRRAMGRPSPIAVAPGVKIGCRRPSAGSGLRVRAAGQEMDAGDSFSGDWPMNWSLASYEDLGSYYERQVLKDEVSGGFLLRDVMSTDVKTVSPEMPLEEVAPLFELHTGLPVLDEQNRLVGVISRRDMNERGGSTVKDIMSSPPIAAKPSSRVADAACLMLKHKVHRIPIVDKQAKVVGIVTRTDIFTALEAEAFTQTEA